ncbi:unnamed protein product [Closterium sp. NIES-54]
MHYITYPSSFPSLPSRPISLCPPGALQGAAGPDGGGGEEAVPHVPPQRQGGESAEPRRALAKPTGNGEIWVLNKTYTQYIPLSVYELDSWLATPSIYVFDSSAAGMIINAFVEYIPLSVYELDSWPATPSIYVFDSSAAGMIINAFVEPNSNRQSLPSPSSLLLPPSASLCLPLPPSAFSCRPFLPCLPFHPSASRLGFSSTVQPTRLPPSPSVSLRLPPSSSLLPLPSLTDNDNPTCRDDRPDWALAAPSSPLASPTAAGREALTSRHLLLFPLPCLPVPHPSPQRPDWALAAPSSPLASPTAASREAAAANATAAAAAAGMRDRILLAACGPEEILPQPSDLPADLFTACLTTPIKIALRWSQAMRKVPPPLCTCAPFSPPTFPHHVLCSLFPPLHGGAHSRHRNVWSVV